jgi:hypothetical protein
VRTRSPKTQELLHSPEGHSNSCPSVGRVEQFLESELRRRLAYLRRPLRGSSRHAANERESNEQGKGGRSTLPRPISITREPGCATRHSSRFLPTVWKSAWVILAFRAKELQELLARGGFDADEREVGLDMVNVAHADERGGDPWGGASKL